MKHSFRKRAPYTRLLAAAAIRPEKIMLINIMLIAFILVTLIAQAMFVNHLNTVSFTLADLSKEQILLSERHNELEARIAERQALGSIEARAMSLGMIPVGNYTFLSGSDTVVAQR